MKKFVVAILVLALVLALVPATVFAATEITDEAGLVAAFENGGSYKLANDIEVTIGSVKKKTNNSVTIDMNGFKIYQDGAINGSYLIRVENGVVTLNDSAATKGSVVGSEYGAIKVSGGASVTVNDGVTLSGKAYGLVIIDGATFTLNNGTVQSGTGVDGESYAISGNGNNHADPGITININGGYVLSGKNTGATEDVGIYMPNTGTINVNGGYIEGDTAISMKSGTLNMNAGTVRSTGAYVATPVYNGNGAEVTGAAISVTTTNGYNGGATVNVKGGTIISDEGSAVYEGISDNAGQHAATASLAVVNVENATVYTASNTVPVIAVTTAPNESVVLDTNTIVVSNEMPVTVDMPVQEAQTEVTASSDPTYTIIIPEAVNFGKINRAMGTQSQPFNVSITDANLQVGASVTVAVASTYKMMLEGDGAELDYKLTGVDTDLYITFGYAGDGVTVINEYTATHEDTVTCEPVNLTRAGNYAGTMTFVCNYVEP